MPARERPTPRPAPVHARRLEAKPTAAPSQRRTSSRRPGVGKALVAQAQPSALLPSAAYARPSRAPAPRYSEEDLAALATVGYDHLAAGLVEEAKIIFEGLCAVAPEVAYHKLALGLVHDQLGDMREADACYIEAGRLDPSDPRPDLNRAEIRLALKRHADAERYLARGLEKAKRAGAEDLARKAETLLAHVRRKIARASKPRKAPAR